MDAITQCVRELEPREQVLLFRFKARVFWLVVLTFFGVITSTFVAQQEELLSSAIVLAAFIAPIIDMGGNTGSQAATLVIRAMALGQVRLRMRDFLFILKRDIPVAIAMGVVIGILEAILAFVSKGVGTGVLLVVGLAMLTVTIVGSLKHNKSLAHDVNLGKTWVQACNG